MPVYRRDPRRRRSWIRRPWASSARVVIAAGNEITDALRAVGLLLGTASSGQMLDGRQNDSTFGIYRAATNLFRRGQCDATTDWNSNGSSLALDATVAPPFSTQSVKVTTNNAGVGEGARPASATGLALAAATSVVAGIWFKGVAGAVYRVNIRINNTDASTTTGTVSTFAASGAWEWVVPTPLVVAAGKTGNNVALSIGTDTQRSEIFWIAHAMLESGQASVAPYVPTFGGSTATHSAGLVQMPASLIASSQGWFACRIRAGFASNDGGVSRPIFSWFTGAGLGLILQYRVSSGQWDARREDSSAALQLLVTDAFSRGDEVGLIFAWTATQIKVSVDGGAFTTLANTETAPAGLPATFQIGGDPSNGSSRADSDYFWAAVGSGTLSDADAATINGFGASDPGPNAFPGTPTAVWHANTLYYLVPAAGLTRSGTLSDVGLTIGDSITAARVTPRALADTGLTIGDSLVVSRTRSLSDVGLTVGDSVLAIGGKALSDTGLTVSDSIQVRRTRTLSDVGLSVSDSLVVRRTRSLSDAGLTVSDSLSVSRSRTFLDTGLTITDTLHLVRLATLTDVGLVIGDSVSSAVTIALGMPPPIVGAGSLPPPRIGIRSAIGGQLLGRTVVGATAFELDADEKRVAVYVPGHDCLVAKLTVYVDGLGSGHGDQVARGIIYDAAWGLAAAGDEVLVEDGQQGSWVDFPMPLTRLHRGLPVALGLIGGDNANTIRMRGDAAVSAGQVAADPYLDGPSDPFGAGAVEDFDLSAFATTFWEYEPRATASRFALGRLPFELAQEELREAAGVREAQFLTTLGWHGTSVDSRRGASFAVVKADGPLSGAVGKVVRVTRRAGARRTPVYALVVGADASLSAPLTLTRRAFLALDELTSPAIPVTVEVMK